MSLDIDHKISEEAILKGIDSWEIEVEHIVLSDIPSESEFEHESAQPLTNNFEATLSKEINLILRQRENLEGMIFKEIELKGFLYANYLEKGDFVEFSFRPHKHTEYLFRWIVESVSSQGFFVTMRMKVDHISHDDEKDIDNTHSTYGNVILTLPVGLRWRRKIGFSTDGLYGSERIRESDKSMNAQEKREIRDMLTSLKKTNDSILSTEKYAEMSSLIRTLSLYWEKCLVSMRCMIPEDSKRDIRLLMLQVKRKCSDLGVGWLFWES